MSNGQEQIETLNNEIQVLQETLDSKTKAFVILINELEMLKHERNQFRSLADSLQEKYLQLRKQITTKIEPHSIVHQQQAVYEHPNDIAYFSLEEKESTIYLLKTALKTVQDEKEILRIKLDELTRGLNDVKGDLSIFRQQRHRTWTDNCDKEDQTILLQRLEQANERINQLDNEFKLIACQKEELEIERDSFKSKYMKFNKLLNGSENCFLDIELVLSENEYLKEKVNELTRENNLALANATKYKELLQTHRSGTIQSSVGILTHKQVQNVIKQSYVLPNTPEIEKDLRSIAEALLDNVKDKNLAIVHQKRLTKILAGRVTELEKRLVECKFSSKSDHSNSLINLLDRTPSPSNPDIATQQRSPTQLFTFPSTSSPSLSTRVLADDFTNQAKGIKYTTSSSSSSSQSTFGYHPLVNLQSQSGSTDLHLTSPTGYLEEKDLSPSTTSHSEFHRLSKDLLENTRQYSTALTNLTC